MFGKLLLVAAASACLTWGAAARGQSAGDGAARREVVSPAGEDFSVEFPARPDVHQESRSVRKVSVLQFDQETEPARFYAAYHDGVVFLVAAFDNPRPHETLAYFAAEFFGGPVLPQVQGRFSRAVRSGRVGGWQYAFDKAGAKGVARLFLTKRHAYMVEAVGGDESHPRVRRFLDSFRLSRRAASGRRAGDRPPRSVGVAPAPPLAAPQPRPPSVKDPQLPVPATIDVDPTLFPPDRTPQARNPPPPGGDAPAGGVGGGVGVGQGSGTGAGRGMPGDADGPFRQAEVTGRANVVFKPTPGFTEEARHNNVTGVVRLRGVLSSDGSVKQLAVVKGLPGGLTEKAAAAARGIRFLPATKDGRRVSQWITLEYNFNIY